VDAGKATSTTDGVPGKPDFGLLGCGRHRDTEKTIRRRRTLMNADQKSLAGNNGRFRLARTQDDKVKAAARGPAVFLIGRNS
jgi:hypothetical protein